MSQAILKVKTGIFRLGTSGIVVPGAKDTFPEAFKNKSRLNYYSSLFNTLEVNSTFKKMPRAETLEKWAGDVSREFRFTLKMSKNITHVKGLNVSAEEIFHFYRIVSRMANRASCLLIQFPASITGEYSSKVENILLQLQQLDDRQHFEKAIEFRSTTWYNNDTTTLLKKYNSSMVLHDMPKSKQMELNDDFKFIYFRFHGPKGDYKGSYSSSFLQDQAEKIKRSLINGKDVYAYFNNTMGNAFENAMTLKGMVDQRDGTEK